MKKILTMLVALFCATSAYTQTLPSGSVGVVSNNTPNTWQSFTYTFTPTQTGANFVGFAFRQDPAFWTFDNVRLTASGSSTNLLVNGAFDNGGSFSVTTSNGPSQIQAPTNWGVWYQNGTYPSAAGTWTDVGGTHTGVWYDGAVGSFDGIYQGVNLVAGTTYTIAFDVSGNGTSNGSSIQLGAYGGACATVTIAPDQCTIPSSVGFTTLATPSQGASAGNPTPPPVTIVSTASGTPRVTSSTSNGQAVTAVSSTRGTTVTISNITSGTTAYTSSARDAAVRDTRNINVTRTTTVVGATPMTRVDTLTTPITVVTVVTTPRITNTTTIPVTVTTYSDGTTTSVDGTPVVTASTTNVAASTTATTNEIVTQTTRSTAYTSASSNQTASVSGVALKDAIAVRTFNPFLVDALSIKDGAWATPSMGYAKAGGTFRTGSLSFGVQNTIDNNVGGIAGSFGKTNSHNYLNSSSNFDSYSGTAYFMNKQDYVWIKGSVGFGMTEYATVTSLPIFALSNSNNVKTKNYYADITLYSGKEVYGFRPLAGVLLNKTIISTKSEIGSSLLSTLPLDNSSLDVRPYAGVRYDFNDSIGIETRVTKSKDFNTVGQVRVSAKKEIFKDVYFDISGGFDKSSNYTAAVGMAGVKINF